MRRLAPLLVIALIGCGKPTAPVVTTPASKLEVEQRAFAFSVQSSLDTVWKKVFPILAGRRYELADIHPYYNGQVSSPCGAVNEATRAFFCSGTNKYYVSLQLLADLAKQAPEQSDFARRYVIAHESAHYIQSLLKSVDESRLAQIRLTGKDPDKVSLRYELQADYIAGVYFHFSDVEKFKAEKAKKALIAVDAVFRKEPAKKQKSEVFPDPLVHGTLEQRVKWFMKGYASGRIREGDTYLTKDL